MKFESDWRSEILRYQPQRRLLLRTAGVAVVAAAVLLAYLAGLRDSSSEESTRASERAEIRARLDESEAALADARQQVTNLEANLEIERAASASVRTELSQAQTQRRRLEQESGLYRSLLNGSASSSGLAVERLELERGTEPRAYRFRLVLLQRAQRHVELSGSIGLTIGGTQSGGARTLSLRDVLVPRGEDRLPMRLLYFQIIEGEVQLPDGFEAQEVRIDAQVTKGRAQKLTFKRAWST